MNLFDRCKLEGLELDAKVSELEGVDNCGPYSTDWSFGGMIIERDYIFITPPTTVHINAGKNSRWEHYNLWRATVSATKRERPNPNDPELPPTVGRGEGATCLIASMRAYVDSKST